MAEPTDPDDDGQPTESSVIKELRAKAKRVEEAEARAAEAERRLAFSEAGLNGLSDKQRTALLAAHDGEVNAEALRSTAEELGFGPKPEAPAPEPEVPGTDPEVREMMRLANSPTPDREPPGAAETEFAKQIEEFDGSYQDYTQFVLRNAHLVPGVEEHGR